MSFNNVVLAVVLRDFTGPYSLKHNLFFTVTETQTHHSPTHILTGPDIFFFYQLAFNSTNISWEFKMQLLKMLETAFVYVVLCIFLESSTCFRLNNERSEVILNKSCVRENRTVHKSPPVSYSPSFSHSLIPSLSPLGNCKSSGWGGHGS